VIRFTGLLASSFLFLCVSEGTVSAQAIVESALGAGRAATMTAPARSLTEGAVGIFGSLDKVMKAAQGQESSSIASVAPRPAKASASKAKTDAGETTSPAPVYEDPLGIRVGLGYEELIRRFGPPAMQITSGPDAKTLSYLTKSGFMQVECEGGKVTSADKPKS